MTQALAKKFKAPSVKQTPLAIPSGKIVDFISGRFFRDTPEEYVRQNIEKALVHQYHYDPIDCVPALSIKIGSDRKQVDIAVFKPGVEHKQHSIWLIVETKAAGVPPPHAVEGVAQLQSYMAACLNCEYGLWTNGDDRVCYAKQKTNDDRRFKEILDIPAAGKLDANTQRPKMRDLVPASGDNLLFAFRRCHNKIAGAEGPHKDVAFWELLKLIFAKIEDERSPTLNFYVTPSEVPDSVAAGA